MNVKITLEDIVLAATKLHRKGEPDFSFAELMREVSQQTKARASYTSTRKALKLALAAGRLEGTRKYGNEQRHRLVDERAAAKKLAREELTERLAVLLGGRAVHYQSASSSGVMLTLETAQALAERLGLLPASV